MRGQIGLLLAGALLAGCATTPSLPAGGAGDQPTPQAVRDAPEAHSGKRARWGGRILFLENQDDSTLVGVIARPLEESGRPREDSADGARFLARVDGFLDPAVYKPDREWSAVGRIEGITTREVGEYPYRYPMLEVERHRLWEERAPVAAAPPPPWYYDPWWPRYRYRPGYPYWY